MDNPMKDLRIDEAQFQADLEAQAAFGDTGDGGLHRPAFSESHKQVRGWFLRRAAEMGLTATVDGAGNHSARLGSSRSGAKTLVIGGHLDSVPYGGRFDGALDVVAGLAVVRALLERGVDLPVDVEVIDFTDEEGRYAGLFGSRAFAGLLESDFWAKGSSEFREALLSSGVSEDSARRAARDPKTLAGYMELHIEQGNRLNSEKAKIGIVTGIVGIRTFHVTFTGRADHAGTRSMNDRKDAGLAACDFSLAVRNQTMTLFPDNVATVGKMDFFPGVFNIVPERVVVTLEFRSLEVNRFERMEHTFLELARKSAEDFGVEAEATPDKRIPPAPTDKRIQAAFTEAAAFLELPHMHMTSGAGHDTVSASALCPAGMIFVPSAGGFSHSPREFTEPQDCINGANTLLQAVPRLTGIVSH